MKKATLFSLLFAIALQVNAQEFAPIGAIWHYTQGTINPDITSFKTLESVADTTINGVTCKKIVEVERIIDTIKVTFQYMYSENDSVFFYKNGGFHLLYDFGANAGDTILLEYFMNLPMIIDSTGTIMVNNVERKIQYITCTDSLVFDCGKHVIEGIGSTLFMFPIADGELNGPLRCYQDDTTGLFLNPFHPNSGWNHEDCEEIITGMAENEINEGITIYPNPTHSTLTVKNLHKASRYKIINIHGDLLMQGNISETTEIDLSSISKGLYFIELQNGEMQLVKKIIRN